MSSFLLDLQIALEPLGLIGARILAGVSGGADSVALLRGLRELALSCRIDLTAAHLNHGLRPGAADDDELWTRELCGRLAVPIIVEKVDVRCYLEARGLNLEEAARMVRYEFFERSARELGCTHVAVAHTADDRAETVLHHLLRGTGLAGLRGMPVSRPLAEGIVLVRPLLRVHRPLIEAWLAEIGQDFRIDATNTDERRTRNRIRHALLPMLEHELGPQVRSSLLRLADQADELQTEITELAGRLLESCLADDTSDMCRLNCGLLERQPRHLVREVFVELWKRKRWPRQAMGFDDWDRLYRLVKEGGRIVLPGKIEAERRGTLLALSQG